MRNTLMVSGTSEHVAKIQIAKFWGRSLVRYYSRGCEPQLSSNGCRADQPQGPSGVIGPPVATAGFLRSQLPHGRSCGNFARGSGFRSK